MFNSGAVISPDGTMIAYPHQSSLWIRELTSGLSFELIDTRGGQRVFWAPTGDAVGYFVVANRGGGPGGGGELRMAHIKDRTSKQICVLPDGLYPRGGAWRASGMMVFGMSPALTNVCDLYQVSSQGGEAEVFLRPDSTRGEIGLIYPTILPDGETLVYVSVMADGGSEIRVQAHDTQETLYRDPKHIMAFPAYATTGYIVYQRGLPNSTGIWALPFDVGRVRKEVKILRVTDHGMAPSVSTDGSLIYRSVTATKQQLAWVDRTGEILETIVDPQDNIAFPALSPDDNRVSMSGREQNRFDIWIHDTQRRTRIRITDDIAYDGGTVWSPRGSQLIYGTVRGSQYDIYLHTFGTRETRPFLEGPLGESPTDWSSDGDYILWRLYSL